MQPSVLVSTYNAPRELSLVLAGIARQSLLPLEVLVADDGSGEETRRVVDEWRGRMPVPLNHVWHADRGRRKSRILNEAARRSRGDLLIFLDGDSVPHRHWVADHLRAARPRRVCCGRRVRLGPGISRRILEGELPPERLERWFGPVIPSMLSDGTKRGVLGLRLPMPIARALHPRPRKLMGVNYSLPRAEFEGINGMDEAFTRYGYEDLDLEIRLRRSGCESYPLLNRAVVYHLYHPAGTFTRESQALIEAVVRSDRVRCERGLDRDRPFDPDGD